MKYYIFFSILLASSKTHALECQWWQTKYSASVVDQHPRQGKTVREHPRREYCKNRWKDADIYVKQFKDYPVTGWPHKGEIFKKWTQNEIRILLEILPLFPIWTDARNYNFLRAKDSKRKGNPATSELTHDLVVLYDEFFKNSHKEVILVHEFGHHLYKNFSKDEKDEFALSSGWSLKITPDGKVFEQPPEKLIIEDSVFDKEEDFSNHLEKYFSNKNDYQKNHPKTFEFLQRKFPR